MDLDPNTRAELAAFFARRFDSTEARLRLAAAAHIDTTGLPPEPRAAWETLLGRARGSRLVALIDAAAAEAPGDPNLAEVRRLLAGPRRGVPIVALAAAGAVVLALGGVGMWAVQGGGGVETVVNPVTPSAASPAEAPAVAERDAPEVPDAGATPGAGAAEVPPAAPVGASRAGAVPAAVPAGAAPTASAAPPAAPPVVPRTATPAVAPKTTAPMAGCTGAPGVVFGWWYAGQADPGAQGTTIALPVSANVRDDYPNKGNHYALDGRVLCSLSAGTRQHLSQAPVHIGGGHYWVPIAGGDLDIGG